MNVERMLRKIAGGLILLSVGLAQVVDWRWYWFKAFMIWCPMMTILRKAGVKG